ncbi:PfkB family carbohydrate kinase [Streptomyces sp. NPDC058807]|uniref:PfkB family carbohydrate kinase n=1 Tax=unclassified Streptomyces TaxID=2593676 RepID=UPI00369661C8
MEAKSFTGTGTCLSCPAASWHRRPYTQASDVNMWGGGGADEGRQRIRRRGAGPAAGSSPSAARPGRGRGPGADSGRGPAGDPGGPGAQRAEAARMVGDPVFMAAVEPASPSLAGEARRLVRGARFLFTNEYEAALLQERTGWTEEEVLRQADVWLLTRGAAGMDIGRSGLPWLHVDAVPAAAVGEPTGVGDAFRAGFLAGVTGGLSYEPAARLGCALATAPPSLALTRPRGDEHDDEGSATLPRCTRDNPGRRRGRALRPPQRARAHSGRAVVVAVHGGGMNAGYFDGQAWESARGRPIAVGAGARPENRPVEVKRGDGSAE